MNYAQHKVFAASIEHPRVIILKSRQQGISTFWLISFFDDALFCNYMNIGLMAQGKEEASTLLERTKLLWDTLGDEVKSFAGVGLDKDNATEFAFSNRSTIFIRVSFRSATLQRLHVSELGKIANSFPKRAREVKTGTLQALGRGNTGVIESTAEGKNMFKDMWEDSVLAKDSGQLSKKDFKPVFLSWLDDPDCIETVDQSETDESRKYFARLEEEGIHATKEQKNFWIVQHRELGSDVMQEYPATPDEAFSSTKDGTYYNRLYHEHIVSKGRVVKNLYDKNLEVDVYWDLGVDDYTVLLFVQKYRDTYRIIDEHFDNGYSIEHYCDIIKVKDYNVRRLRFPHDVANRQMGKGDSQGRAMSLIKIVQEYMRENNVRWLVGKPISKLSVEVGIAATRSLIPKLMIDAGCVYLSKCMQRYTKKYDEKLDIWLPSPLHDEYSHGADCLRGIAVDNMGNQLSRLESGKPQRNAGGFDL